MVRGQPDDALERLIDEVTDRLAAGQRIDLEAWERAHPEHSHKLHALLPALKGMSTLRQAATLATGSSHRLPPTLGDFRLVQEIAHGGMGVVYEAEQLSLGRRVALKILPYAAVLDSRQLVRFQNEAQAAAQLDHPHIVSVIAFGCERGVYYYAMQYVEGRSLAEMIDELREESGVRKNAGGDGGQGSGDGVNSSADRGQLSAGDGETTGQFTSPSETVNPKSKFTPPPAPCPPSPVPFSPQYFRHVAELGIQVAEALEYAHQHGVVHRDVKPANLLLDGDGNVWITDFGLARSDASATLTKSGDVLGTLRYMSPEQAGGRRAVVDERTDIYSLGATLYELLTLQPVFGREQDANLVREITEAEPQPPRRLVASVPRDLETIVLKSLEKHPEDRYASAQALADDLGRFLGDEPIQAQPPSTWDRLAKWSRRHVGIVWTALAACLLGLALFTASTAVIVESRRAANSARQSAEQERNDAVTHHNEAHRNQYFAEIVSGQTNLERGNIGRLEQKLIRHLPLDDEPDRRDWEWYYLYSYCHPEERTLYYPSYVLYAAWSPDGKYVATSGTIWNAETGECVRRMWPGGEEGVAWSPDSQSLAWGTCADNSAIYIWDQQTDSISELRGHGSSVWCVAFSPDGKQLASGSIDGTVKIWDLATSAVLQTFLIQKNVSDVAWSPNGELLAIGACNGGGLQIWSVPTGERIVVRKEPNDTRVMVSWRPDGQQLAVNTSDHWYILDQPEWNPVSEHGHRFNSEGAGNDVEWDPSGTLVAISDGKVVTIWDPVKEVSVTKLRGHVDRVNSIAWGPAGRRLLTTDRKLEIKSWDLESSSQPPSIVVGDALQSIHWEADSSSLVSIAAADLTSTFWRVTDAVRIKDVPAAVTRDENDVGVLSPDRHLIAHWTRADDEVTITVRDAESGAVHSVWHEHESFTPLSFAWSPDGSKLAIGILSADELCLDIWDVNEERQISRWARGNLSVGIHELHFPTWSPDGRRVAVVGYGEYRNNDAGPWESCVHVIDVTTGRRVFVPGIGHHGGTLRTLTWSSDGRALGVGTSEGRVDLLEVDTGKRIMSCIAHDAPISALDLSPDGQRLATAAADGVVKVIESQNGNELLTFHLDQRVNQIAWSPDGQRLAAVTEEGTIQVWDASRGYEFAKGGPRRQELAWAYYRLADENAGEDGDRALRKALELAPQTKNYRSLRGHALARLGQYHAAAREFTAAVSSQNEVLVAAMAPAIAMLGDRDLDSYRQFQATLVGIVQNSKNTGDRLNVAWLGALIPDAVDSFADLVTSLRERVGETEPDPNAFDPLQKELHDSTIRILGAMLYRLGRYNDAARTLKELTATLEKKPGQTSQYYLACAQYFLAMSRYQLGHEFQARRYLNQALATDQTLQSDHSFSWTGRVILNTLRREASAVVGSDMFN